MAETHDARNPWGEDQRFHSTVGEADTELDQRLSDELDQVNAGRREEPLRRAS